MSQYSKYPPDNFPGTGTVTSVGLSAPASIFLVVGSPVTTTGTLALALADQQANTVFAGPASGPDAPPTFRAIVSDDITSLDVSKITGAGDISTSTTGVTVVDGVGATLGTNTTINIQTATGAQPGLLSAADFTTFNSKQAAGSYITALTGDVVATGPGSVAATIQPGVVSNSKLGTDAVTDVKVAAGAAIARSKLASGTANHVLINDGAGVMSSEAALDETRGGTGQTTYATGDTLYASAANTLSKLSAGATGTILRVVAGVPVWEPQNDPAAQVELYEDWITDAVGNLRWLDGDVLTGVSATTLTNNDASHPGVVEFATGTNVAGAAIRTLGGVTSGTHTTGFLVGGGTLMFEYLVRFTSLSTITQEYQFTVGLADSVTAATALITIHYDRLNSGVNWQGITRSASVTTTTDLGVVAAAGTWYKLGVEVNAAGTLVTFYINGTSVGTSATNIPTSTVIAPRINMTKTLGTTNRLAYVDYFKLYQRLTTAR